MRCQILQLDPLFHFIGTADRVNEKLCSNSAIARDPPRKIVHRRAENRVD
jgi:hypothetical protein